MEIRQEMCARVCVHSANPHLAGRWLRRQVKVMVVGGMKRPDCKWLASHFRTAGAMLSRSSDLRTPISFLLFSLPSPFC